MNLCMMAIFCIVCSISRCFNLSEPMSWLPYLGAFGQFLLNPVSAMITGWICRWSLSIVWSVYDVDEIIWVRILLIIL